MAKKNCISDVKWKIINPEYIFKINATDYVLTGINFSEEELDNSTLLLKLKIFLAKGKLIGIFNPINEVLRLYLQPPLCFG